MALDQEKLNRFRVQKERLGGMLSDASEVINSSFASSLACYL